MRYLGLHEPAFSRSRGRLPRAHTALGWAQLTFSCKFIDAHEPALPLWLCGHIHVCDCEPFWGLCCLEMWIPPRKGSSCLIYSLSFLPPSLRLSPNVEPSSTVVSLEWLDVQPAIGTKVSDYVLQHKKVDEYTDTDLYTGGCEGGQPPRAAGGSWRCFLCPAWLGAAALVESGA